MLFVLVIHWKGGQHSELRVRSLLTEDWGVAYVHVWYEHRILYDVGAGASERRSSVGQAEPGDGESISSTALQDAGARRRARRVRGAARDCGSASRALPASSSPQAWRSTRRTAACNWLRQPLRDVARRVDQRIAPGACAVIAFESACDRDRSCSAMRVRARRMMNRSRHRRIEPAGDRDCRSGPGRRLVECSVAPSIKPQRVLRAVASRCRSPPPARYLRRSCECRRSAPPGGRVWPGPEAIQAAIRSAESATKRREAANSTPPRPAPPAHRPRAAAPPGRSGRVVTPISIRFIAQRPSQFSAFAPSQLGNASSGGPRACEPAAARPRPCRRGSRSGRPSVAPALRPPTDAPPVTRAAQRRRVRLQHLAEHLQPRRQAEPIKRSRHFFPRLSHRRASHCARTVASPPENSSAGAPIGMLLAHGDARDSFRVVGLSVPKDEVGCAV